MEEKIYELYGMKFKVVKDDRQGDCDLCALKGRCELEDVDICRCERIGRNKHFEKIS